MKTKHMWRHVPQPTQKILRYDDTIHALACKISDLLRLMGLDCNGKNIIQLVELCIQVTRWERSGGSEDIAVNGIIIIGNTFWLLEFGGGMQMCGSRRRGHDG